jgi:Ca-activated chloride channel family protein
MKSQQVGRRESYAAGQQGLRALADDTGGFFLHDSDLSRGIERFLRDLGGYYLLGYAPAATDTPAPRFHRVEVRVKRPGLKVRARSGYWAGTSEPLEYQDSRPRR